MKKIVVDYDLCEANACCMRVCPEVFEVDDEDNLIVKQDSIDDALRSKVEQALRVCPRQALTLIDE